MGTFFFFSISTYTVTRVGVKYIQKYCTLVLYKSYTSKMILDTLRTVTEKLVASLYLE